jgi:hypothetical protein
MSTTARMSASTCWTASYPSRCGATPSALRRQFVFLPRGRPHQFWAVDQRAWLLLIAVPDGIEDYFHLISTASTGDQNPPDR